MNTARGDQLDEEQVAATLHDGRLGAAADDVLASEPAFASPLLEAPMGLWAVREVIRVLGGESPLYPVPLPRGQEV